MRFNNDITAKFHGLRSILSITLEQGVDIISLYNLIPVQSSSCDQDHNAILEWFSSRMPDHKNINKL